MAGHIYVLDESLELIFSSEGGDFDAAPDTLNTVRQFVDDFRAGQGAVRVRHNKLMRLQELTGPDDAPHFAVLVDGFDPQEVVEAARVRFDLTALEARALAVILDGHDRAIALTHVAEIGQAVACLYDKTRSARQADVVEREFGTE